MYSQIENRLEREYADWMTQIPKTQFFRKGIKKKNLTERLE